jgi:hypothetical protein
MAAGIELYRIIKNYTDSNASHKGGDFGMGRVGKGEEKQDMCVRVSERERERER